MTTNYQETAVSGTKWKRCVRLVCNNPYGGVPSVRFEEEEALTIDGQTIYFPINEMFIKAFSPGATFPLLNPANGVPTGVSMTHAELVGVLYSLYIACAIERDGG